MSRFSIRSVADRWAFRLLAVLWISLSLPTAAQAYIGPGAGFALLSSFLVIFTTIILAIATLLIWPFRMLYRAIRRREKVKPLVRRLVIVGFDGQDPRLTERYMKEGKMPNFSRLADSGCFKRLKTTFPSISPTAWSSFSTGSHPPKHNIYDFLDRDRKTYLPVLSSTYIGGVDKFLKLGKFRIPLKKPEIRLLRRSKASWTILGEHNVWSTVLRVPITFPPESFYGCELSAMCTPDLLGTQGTFLLYTTRPAEGKFKEGGIRIQVAKNGKGTIETKITGPENAFLAGNPPMEVPVTIRPAASGRSAEVEIDGEKVQLREKQLSDWVRLIFKAAPGIKVNAITRMMIVEMGEHFSLYMTPLNFDPENPAMPISHPSYYSTYLAKKIGPFSTLGLAEDTWALNEGVIDDATFLKLSYDIDKEREAMFFAGLERLRKGSLVCVFDGIDRIQHMFWRYHEKGHPAAKGRENSEHGNAVEEIYRHNDALLGRILEKIGDRDMIMVISDHGFDSFRRGVNLNAWLHRNGYLHLKEGAAGNDEWLTQVDWSRTKAYQLGLTGMFLNIKGREAQGIVEPGKEAVALKKELISKLNGLMDTDRGVEGIKEVFDTAELYSGPYLENAPDLIIGYNAGYRTSWDAATGVVDTPVFEDNVKAWSGDHCIDPRQVPGIFFCNRKIDEEDPSLIDIAPTALRLFGVEPPAHMDGKPLFKKGTLGAAGPSRQAAAG